MIKNTIQIEKIQNTIINIVAIEVKLSKVSQVKLSDESNCLRISEVTMCVSVNRDVDKFDDA